jgi:hypothetical protein
VHDHGVTDDLPAPPTVRDRLTAAGLSAGRIEQHLAAGRIRLDGALVEDLDQAAAPPTRIVVGAE